MRKIILLIFFSVIAMASDSVVEIYNCYGGAHHLKAEGRVVKEKTTKKVQVNDSVLKNFTRKISRFFNKEKKDIVLGVKIGNSTYYTKTDDEGYFDIDMDVPMVLGDSEIIDIYLDEENTTHARCIMQHPLSNGIGVISDFDDTLIVSNVPSKSKLFKNTFMKNYKQRRLVKSTAIKIKSILSQQKRSAFFVLSSSPNQISNSINNFLDYNDMPDRSIITKKIHGSNGYSILKQSTYKSDKIKKLISIYPDIKWTLFGDSGEQDKQIYSEIDKSYSDSIESIYIRNVITDKLEKIK